MSDKRPATPPPQATLSVVIPNHNHAQFLPQALDAIIAQSRAATEVLVIDDASEDKSVELLHEYARRHPFIKLYCLEKNVGVVEAMNCGVQMAGGEYVFLASADDEVLPGLFEKSMYWLERFPEAGVCSALCRTMDERGRDTGLYSSRLVSREATFLPPQAVASALERHGCWFVGSTSFFKRKGLEQIGGFRPDLGPFVDGFTQEVLALQHGACFIPEALARWRVVEAGYSIWLARQTSEYIQRVEYMVELMRTTFGGVFSDRYVESRRRECLYGVGVHASKNVTAAADLYLSQLARVLSPVRALDRLILAGVGGGVRSLVLAVNGYLFLRRRRLTTELLRRRLRWLAAQLTRQTGRGAQ